MAKLRKKSPARPKVFSKVFKVDLKKMNALGVFDPCLNIDTKLFIDPLLLKSCKNPIINKNAVKTFREHFETVVILLIASKAAQDFEWRNARRQLSFPEKKGTCLGYGKETIDGAAFGPKKTLSLMNNAQRAISLGVKNPNLFLALTIFEEGVGADLVSDMTTNIIYRDLADYTVEIMGKLKLKFKTMSFSINGTNYDLIENPLSKGNPIIFVPKDVLRDLPVTREAGVQSNHTLRHDVSREIAEIWKVKTQKAKDEALDTLLKDKDAFDDFLAYLESLKGKGYDFKLDKKGEVLWHDYYESLANKFNFKASGIEKKSPEDLIKYLLAQFKNCIENNGMWKELWAGNVPRSEKNVQRLFFLFSILFCEHNDLDISPESDAGTGPVDFKFSRGKTKVLVEIKLSNNSYLATGYECQLDAYKKAERPSAAYYMVVQVDEPKKFKSKLTKLKGIKAKLTAAGKPHSEILVIDGNKQVSASKRKPN